MAVWGVTVPALLWGAAFTLGLHRFGRWLMTARADGEPG
jgi:uncharacterized protein involved in response to NO